MPAAAFATLVLVGVLVAALAVTLIWVVGILVRTVRSLERISVGVAAITEVTAPIGAELAEVEAQFARAAEAFEQVGDQEPAHPKAQR